MDTTDFHPDAASLDAWITFLRQDAATSPRAANASFQDHCGVGELVLNTKGHPQGVGSTAQPLNATYAPPAPALNVRATAVGQAITVAWVNDPASAKLVVEEPKVNFVAKLPATTVGDVGQDVRITVKLTSANASANWLK